MITNNLQLHTAIWMKLTNRKLNKRWQTHANKYSMIAFIESSNPSRINQQCGKSGWLGGAGEEGGSSANNDLGADT